MFHRRFETSVDTVKKEPEDGGSNGVNGVPSFFMANKNPLQFFVRDSLPSTESSLRDVTASPSAPPLEEPSGAKGATPPQKESASHQKSGADNLAPSKSRRSSVSPSLEQVPHLKS